MSRGEAGGWLDTAPGASFCRDRRSGQMLGGEQQREFYVDPRRPYAPPEGQGLGSGLSLLVHAATGQMSRWRKGGRGVF